MYHGNLPGSESGHAKGIRFAPLFQKIASLGVDQVIRIEMAGAPRRSCIFKHIRRMRHTLPGLEICVHEVDGDFVIVRIR